MPTKDDDAWKRPRVVVRRQRCVYDHLVAAVRLEAARWWCSRPFLQSGQVYVVDVNLYAEYNERTNDVTVDLAQNFVVVLSKTEKYRLNLVES